LSGTRTLEDRLPTYRQTRAIPHGRRLRRTWRWWWRRCVNRTRTRLRHNHAANWRRGRLARRLRTGRPRLWWLVAGRLGGRGSQRRGGLCLRSGSDRGRCIAGNGRGGRGISRHSRGFGSHWSLRHGNFRWGGSDRGLDRRRGRSGNFRNRRGRRRGGSDRRLGHLNGRDLRAHGDRLRGDQARRALGNDRRSRPGCTGLVDDSLGWSWRRRWRCNRFHGRLLARQDSLEGIAGLRDLGEIDFRAELFAAGAVAVGRTAVLLEIFAYLLGFIGFDGAGVSLFLRDANLNKHVENLFAFYFQLASQIVNSNLHPPFISLCLNRIHLPGPVWLRCARCCSTGEVFDWKTSMLRLPGHSPRRPRNWLPKEKLVRAWP